METYGCLDGPFDDFLRECARRAAASGTTSASSSTLVCFFRQRVSVALQHAQAVAVQRRTLSFDAARASPEGAHRRVDLLFTDDAGGRSLGDVVVADPTRFDHVARCAGPTGLGVAARLAASCSL